MCGSCIFCNSDSDAWNLLWADGEKGLVCRMALNRVCNVCSGADAAAQSWGIPKWDLQRELATPRHCPTLNRVQIGVCVCVRAPRYQFQSCSSCEVQQSYILPLLQTMSSVFGPEEGSPDGRRAPCVQVTPTHHGSRPLETSSIATRRTLHARGPQGCIRGGGGGGWGKGGGGFGWDPPPPMVPAEGGPKILKLKSSWH